MTGEVQVHRVTVENRLSRGTNPGRDYRGRCYEMTVRYLADHRLIEPELRLVHGTLTICGNLFLHAWVELPQSIVFDGTTQEFYDRDGYYRVLHAAAERVYTPAEAGQLVMTTKHCGPWHDTRLGSNAAVTAHGKW